MKRIKFKPYLVELTLSGRKTMTWRLFDDKDLQIGDKFECVHSETDQVFAQAEITDVWEKKLGEVTDSDYEGHDEKYPNKEEMLKVYKGYYGDSATLDSPLKIIKFKLMLE
jgi:hypothetical protein